MPRTTRVAIGLLVAGVLSYLIFASMHSSQYRVNVCIDFGGRTACAEAAGKTRAEALRAAQQTACGQVASGVTDTVACERVQPARTEWLGSPSGR